jgi:tetratricopeptide (TPR) repeat protein
VAGAGLVLRAVEVGGPLRWRWLLSDAESGAALADHQVDLDPGSAEVARFGDLYGYARAYAAPDRRVADEARIVAEAGAWAGRALLGEPVGAAIVRAARSGPVTVRVTVPAEARRVLSWPLELAHVNGGPLAARGDVTLVYDSAPEGTALGKDAVSEALRVLAVFSQPTETSVLALRRERYALGRFIRRIAARQRARVELRVVQYGVTRELLKEIAEDGDGWDVLHLSGHGGRGVFLLERPDGTPDPVDTAGLLELLRPARSRVKLAVLSACQSAADTTAETLRLVGLTDQADAIEQEPADRPSAEVTGLARSLVRELDCAVVAMRYPVTDEFAIAFGEVLYEQLLSRGQPVDVAAARALAQTAGPDPSAARPAVSMATPGVFGARAAGLTLKPPRGTPVLDPAERRMAYFPPEPERFVGRAAAMAAASAALATDSGRTAVLLYGMAGAGKTACALELAYRHHDGFAAAAFWQAPTKDDEWTGALPSLAAALEAQLGGYGFAMTGHIGTVAALEAFLPRLRRVLEDSGILLVLDNLETLLTPEGAWRDPRWSSLMGALMGHGGESRLIVTSRIRPAGLGPEVLTLPVHALSLAEAVALARELPNLRGLLHAEAGSVRAQLGIEVDTDRDRVRRALHVVQGHPKLLELADAAAADRERLDAQLASAEQAAAGDQLEAFFRDGASTLDPGQFLAALATWTGTTLAALPEAARLLAQFLACLEDDDRRPGIIEATWPELWRRLGRPGDPPDPGPLLQVLAAAALIQPEYPPAADGAQQSAPGTAVAPARYRMHPGVAAAISAAAASQVRDAADTELAAFWQAVAAQAREREGGEDTALIVHAGLAAAPYLLRRHDWNTASTLLEGVIVRDASPGVIQAALPALRRIAAATQAPDDLAVLGRALRTVDPSGAERLLRNALGAAAGSGDDRLASGIAGELLNLLRDTGRLREALDLAGQKARYTQQAGLGAWTQLLDQAWSLRILARMGEHEQVLAQTAALRARMGELPARRTDNETVTPWNVREVILDTGRHSALALGRCQQCLDLNAEITASRRQRGTGLHEITRTRFNDAGPLIELGRLPEADQLLRECQQVFEDHADTTMLARVLSTRALLEDALERRDAAAEFERTAIRLLYSRPDPRDIAISHHNLAVYLGAAAGDPATQRAHQLAAALIFQLTGMAHDLARALRALATELRQDGGAGALPTTVAEVIRVAEQTDGVHLGELISALEPGTEAAEDALARILHAAADLPANDDTDVAEYLERWEPVIADVTAACFGDQDAAAQLGPFLEDQATEPDWAALIAVLRRILGGERGEGLLDGLDAVDAAIAGQVLTRLAGGEQEPRSP